MTLARIPLHVLAPAALALAAPAQVLVESGDDVPGFGTVSFVAGGACNAAGQWAASVNGLPFGAKSAVLVDGVPVLQTGDALLWPPGATIGHVGALAFDDLGRVLHAHDLDPAPLVWEQHLYLGPTEVAVQGAPSADPSAGGAPYGYLWTADVNDQGRVVAVTELGTAPAIVAFDVGPTGALLQETVLHRQGDLLPGLPSPIWAFLTLGGQLAVTEAGEALYVVADHPPAFAGDYAGAAVYLGLTKLVREGEPTPVAGRVWRNVAFAKVHANDAGDWVVNGRVDGDLATNGLIVKNGAKLVQEGDVLPDIAPFRITSLGTSDEPLGPTYARAFVTNAGHVVWWGEWDDPDTTKGRGVFVDDRLMVQKGVTTLFGKPITDVWHTNALDVEEDSGLATLVVSTPGAQTLLRFLATTGLVAPYAGCAPNAGVLTHVEGEPFPGVPLRFELDHGQAPGVLTLLGVSLQPIAGFPPCGVAVSGGELLIDVLPPNPVAVFGNPAPWLGSPVLYSFVLPEDPVFLGTELFLQGLFVDPGGLAPSEPLRLTDAYELRFGA